MRPVYWVIYVEKFLYLGYNQYKTDLEYWIVRPKYVNYFGHHKVTIL